MSRWEVHLSYGLFALLMLILSIILALIREDGWRELGSVLPVITAPVLLGGVGLIIGSVVPDVDGRGKIRWIAGPTLGMMILLPPLLGSIEAGGAEEALRFTLGTGAIAFTIGTLAGYLFLLIPLRHQGMIHRPTAAILYGILWGSYAGILSSAPFYHTILIGVMGSVGYLWHLALDGRLP